jgi:hypothetical protein
MHACTTTHTHNFNPHNLKLIPSPAQTNQPQDDKLEGRVAALEGRLSGVYNLGGKLIAVEAMAGDMGYDMPDLEVGRGGGGQAEREPGTRGEDQRP